MYSLTFFFMFSRPIKPLSSASISSIGRSSIKTSTSSSSLVFSSFLVEVSSDVDSLVSSSCFSELDSFISTVSLKILPISSFNRASYSLMRSTSLSPIENGIIAITSSIKTTSKV